MTLRSESLATRLTEANEDSNSAFQSEGPGLYKGEEERLAEAKEDSNSSFQAEGPELSKGKRLAEP